MSLYAHTVWDSSTQYHYPTNTLTLSPLPTHYTCDYTCLPPATYTAPCQHTLTDRCPQKQYHAHSGPLTDTLTERIVLGMTQRHARVCIHTHTDIHTLRQTGADTDTQVYNHTAIHNTFLNKGWIQPSTPTPTPQKSLSHRAAPVLPGASVAPVLTQGWL